VDVPTAIGQPEKGPERAEGREQREGQGRWAGVADETRTAIRMRRLAGSLQVPYLGILRIETVT
jgi:hypothetical protein